MVVLGVRWVRTRRGKRREGEVKSERTIPEAAVGGCLHNDCARRILRSSTHGGARRRPMAFHGMSPFFLSADVPPRFQPFPSRFAVTCSSSSPRRPPTGGRSLAPRVAALPSPDPEPQLFLLALQSETINPADCEYTACLRQTVLACGQMENRAANARVVFSESRFDVATANGESAQWTIKLNHLDMA